MRTVVTAKKLWDKTRLIDYPVVIIEDGVIAGLADQASTEIPEDVQVLDFPDATLAPAFFDVHFHGAAGHDVMEATPAALSKICGFLATRGTGSFLATTVTAPMDATLRAVEGLAKLIEQVPAEGQARIVGIHLEGPFLSHAKRGVQPAAHLLAPDIGTFDKLVDAANGHVKLMTLAPELLGAIELARHATSRGVRISVGHSDATAAATKAVIGAGAVSATHTFNAMRPLDHREPGILGTVLATDELFAELICDGIHTAPEMAKIWWRAKGAERGILITDAMSAAGMPDGEYTLGGFPVQVAAGKATANGVLAGSVLTLDRALKNFMHFTGATVEDGLRLLTTNPAVMTGLNKTTGTLAVGQSADLVAVSAEGHLMGSIIGGRQVAAA
jgi:N-acetylglucosamine-6-phosphate deacetylase